MVVSVGGPTTDTEGGPASAGTGPPGPDATCASRRDLVRGLVASAAILGVAPLAVASLPARREEPPANLVDPANPRDRADLAFDEVYRSRRIRGMPVGTAGPAFGAGSWQVTVDGRPLHLMRRADGGWLSMVDHYCSYPTPLEAARAAVDELGPAQRLRYVDPAAGHHEEERHGVHA
ncbi:tyrosinase cofactor [Streptomyces sp. JB150]|uniref:tyrosinase cofactor n=1 Tax=Streptomyces sp. JB150 TaxID=2714844 RepID=UPI0014093D99|nr:tyrosinase cofactor [Streptomyces sp. JB150]QIJ62734.1 tyrosinase co-factor [Streptomyces sp. JB150]